MAAYSAIENLAWNLYCEEIQRAGGTVVCEYWYQLPAYVQSMYAEKASLILSGVKNERKEEH